jgi:hypothetical protein
MTPSTPWPPPPMRDPRPEDEDGGFDTPQPIREHTQGWMPGSEGWGAYIDAREARKRRARKDLS